MPNTIKHPLAREVVSHFETAFPDKLRKQVEKADKDDILSPSFPYDAELDRDDYEDLHKALQIELVKMQSWVASSGERVVVVLEGRDAAGKGGTIKRFRENLNPRVARTIALAKPSDVERGQWYFQRYISQMPSAGQIAFFDRSWYNRAVVERVFGFASDAERELFFQQVPDFEEMLVRDGVHLYKIWLTVSRAEQMRRFLKRARDPLKQWKLSTIDLESLGKWDAYSEAIGEMFTRTHRDHAPWHVIRADDKRRARLAAIQLVLSALPYHGKDEDVVASPDPKIAGGPELNAERAD